MKQALTFNPTFTASAGTLNFTGLAGGFSLNRLQAVINNTRNAIIYCPAMGSGYGYSNFAANTITLQYSTVGMADSDSLTCLYDVVGATTSANASPVTLATDSTGVPQRQVYGTPTSGSLAAAAQTVVTTALDGYNGVFVSLTGTFTGLAVAWEVSIDNGTTWLASALAIASTQGLASTTASNLSAAALYYGPVTGGVVSNQVLFRVRCTAITTGSASISIIPCTQAPSINQIGTVSNGGTISTITNANLGLASLVADQTSAAITTTANSAAITAGSGVGFVVSMAVTAASGTLPTYDLSVEESLDSGTNWTRIYDFPRITATGFYESPILQLRGNRIRYVSTIGGTGPSFTRSISRLQNSIIPPLERQRFDRSIVLTTLSSTTATLVSQNCSQASLVVNIGAATTAPVLQLQGSDDFGATWFDLGSPLQAIASSTVRTTCSIGNAQQLRAIVKTAGATVTAGYVLIKAAQIVVNGDTAARAGSAISSFTSTSSATLLAANNSRKSAIITNEGAGTLYVLIGLGTASATNYSVSLASGDVVTLNGVTQALTGIFGAAGTARVTELT